MTFGVTLKTAGGKKNRDWQVANGKKEEKRVIWVINEKFFMF